MARILVVGGAGYVGSAVCAWLSDRGHDVWVLDDLSTGHRELLLGRGFTPARAGDRNALSKLLRLESFDCAMHFSAKALVGESVLKPSEYFENNVEQTRALVETLLQNGVRRIVFSSTCAIFGNPGDRPIDESLPKNPINPYGESKLQAERMLAEYARTHGLQAIALRYFNAAGAEVGLRVGELHAPETHLIPRVLTAATRGTPIEIYGDDYPTPDGTCIRDYVHVSDLAAAHEAAMQRMIRAEGSEGRFEAFNLGSEKGYSVKEIIAACEKVTGLKLPIVIKPRRPGDPPRLVANSNLARRELGFSTAAHPLESIIRTAWEWEKKSTGCLRAVFLDRDGTINDDPGYLNHPDQMKLLPHVREALASLKQAGYLLIIVSNQSGVGRGLIQESEIPKINLKLESLLAGMGAEPGVRIDDYRLCFHTPESGCECRKPKAKLLLDAAQELKIDLSRSFMVGDKVSDLQAGRAAGCKGVILVRTGYGVEAESRIARGEGDPPDFTGDSLLSAARWILSQESASP